MFILVFLKPETSIISKLIEFTNLNKKFNKVNNLNKKVQLLKQFKQNSELVNF